MKNPHEQSKYVKITDAQPDGPTEDPTAAPAPKAAEAYYYVDKDEQRLAATSFTKTVLTVIAFMLQIAALFMPEQAGAMYVSKHIESYGLLYVLFTIFGMLGVSIWLLVMNQIRYKIAKRIPAKHAPKNGFKNRAYFGQELYMAVTAVMAAFQLSFVCIRFDGWGLGAFFVCLASLAAAVAARQITHLMLKDAELIPAPADSEDPAANTEK